MPETKSRLESAKEEYLLKRNIQDKEKKMEETRNVLESRLRASIQKHGLENSQTKLLAMLYNVVDKMSEATETLKSLSIGYEAVFSTLGYLDETMAFIEQLIDTSNQSKHNWFTRHRAKRKTKKAVKQIYYRSLEMSDKVVAITEISDIIIEAFDKSMRKIDKKLAKNEAKKKKEEQKRIEKGEKVQNFADTAAGKIVAEELAKKGESMPSEAPSDDMGDLGSDFFRNF